MSRKALAGGTLLAVAVAVSAAIAFGEAGTDDEGRVSGGSPSLASSIAASSQEATFRYGAVSVCAEDNGEPALLACGLRSVAPEGPALPVRRGVPVRIQLAVPAARVFQRQSRATADGRIIEVTRYAQLASDDDPMSWRVPSPPPDSESTFLDILVVYRDPVRLQLQPGRLSKPYQRASAEFAIPLRQSGDSSRDEGSPKEDG